MGRRARWVGWVVGGTLLALAVTGGAVAVLHRPGPAAESVPGPSRTAPPSTAPVTHAAVPPAAGTNRALAAAEVEQLAQAFPVPPGSRPVPASPVRPLRRLVDGGVASDLSLRHVGWWVVPLPWRSLVHWYGRHSPVRLFDGELPSSLPVGSRGFLGWRDELASPAYTDPEVTIAYSPIGRDRTALRADVSLAAYSDRTAETLVPTTVTSIHVLARAIDGTRPLPHASVGTSDPAVLQRVLSSFDALAGAPEGIGPGGGCGSLVESPGHRTYAYSVTFRWPGHVLVVNPGQPSCGVGMGLVLDGHRLPQVLAGTEELDRSLLAAVRSVSPGAEPGAG